jgi:hypothetical protein
VAGTIAFFSALILPERSDGILFPTELFGDKGRNRRVPPARKTACNQRLQRVPVLLRGFYAESAEKEVFMPIKSIKRSVNFQPETLETLEKLAAKNHTTTAELVRKYVEQGISVDGYKQDVDFIARIVRQELSAIYHIEDIKATAEQQANRIAKMHMKSGKIMAASFFLLIKVLMEMAGEGTADQFNALLDEAMVLGVDYMQKKDFQINSFLYDTDYLRNLAGKL